MSIAIRAATLQCAQSGGRALDAFSDGLFARLQHPVPPARRTAHFLGDTVSLPYFAAFAAEKLSAAALFDILADHLAQAAQQAGWPSESLRDTPVFIGSTAYLMSERELMLDPAYMPATEIGGSHGLHHTADHLRQRLGNPDVFSFATSCTSSANALVYAVKMLREGWCKRALVLGFENFNALTFEHFHAMGLLAATPDYAPFSGGNGFICGEAAACLALESGTDAPALISGIAARTDTLGLTATDSNALRQVMQAALDDAGVAPEHIRLVKSHGVGSAASDEAEAAALKTLLPDAPPAALKPYIGHTLGASGAAETALLLACLQQSRLPPLPASAAAARLPAHGQTLADGAYLLNFFGFGGSNISCILEYRA
ncbi:MAG: beta-ketoacyl synthase N-terminal-like domain-containing protein [Neisseria sp.]|nr:beta-ketoacyl synthase N-terminal-like domain-containing protein [Neisseria sp.]